MLMFFDPKLNQSDLGSNTRVEEGVEGGLDILQEVGKHHHDVETKDKIMMMIVDYHVQRRLWKAETSVNSWISGLKLFHRRPHCHLHP